MGISPSAPLSPSSDSAWMFCSRPCACFIYWRACKVLFWTPAFIFENRRRRTRSLSSHSKSFKSTLSENALAGSWDMFDDPGCPSAERPPPRPPAENCEAAFAGFVTVLRYFFSRVFFLRISSLICSRASRKNYSTSLR